MGDGSGCQSVASNTYCASELASCADNDACADYISCLADCNANSACGALETCLVPCDEAVGFDRQYCIDACRRANDAGVAAFDALQSCIYCTAGCKQLCPSDGPTCP